MAGAKADMVYADPPYGIAVRTDWDAEDLKQSGAHSTGKIKKHVKVHGDDVPFDPRPLLEYFADVAEIFFWGGDYFAQHLPTGGSYAVWDKRTKADGEALNVFMGSDFELCWSKHKHRRLMARILWSGLCQGPKEGARVHPTQKPVMLTEWFLQQWGKPGDLVVDPFGGSGSALLGCEKQQRRCGMIEIAPAYCDVIIARWEKLTGQKAERITCESEAS
ncbi:MAG: site-specific DNA-methyltransferase [Cytophagaceae bacterium]|nr:MAG: site-specific DNA-methyltransferase [Cytophagaceae bacterium]